MLVQPECLKPNVHFMTIRLFWLLFVPIIRQFHLKRARTEINQI